MNAEVLNLVWLKRDLRLLDHEPLQRALEQPGYHALVFCFEEEWLKHPTHSANHSHFVATSLVDMQKRLPKHALWIWTGDFLNHLESLVAHYSIKLFSYQEVGLGWSYQRDQAVLHFCRTHKIDWVEIPYGSIIRGAAHRVGWDDHWKKCMSQPVKNPPLHQLNPLPNPQPAGIPKTHFKVKWEGPPPGETHALTHLHQIIAKGAKGYARGISHPERSNQTCTRLSAALAYGNLSLRTMVQQLAQLPATFDARAAMSRLHWREHFIQKFESDCTQEFEPLNPAAKGLDAHFQSDWFTAWTTGQTGFPFVDACMRCLTATGHINFRMRAMLFSFWNHLLNQPWQPAATFLATCFVDFEPGIHYPQIQMQAGITGINTLRIYNPIKQGLDLDPKAEFIGKWLPELNDLPTALKHQPWLRSPMEKTFYPIQYPEPLVDLDTAYKNAKTRLYTWRSSKEVQLHLPSIVQKHTTKQREPNKRLDQLNLFGKTPTSE